MFKRDPDDLISAASKNLKKQQPKVMRITLKRGGTHFAEIPKAHSRLAKQSLKERIKQIANQNQNSSWPLYARYKQNTEKKQVEQQQPKDPVRFNAQVRINKGNDFIRSLLGVFRVNFFKKKEQQNAKEKIGATKKNPQSKRTHKKIQKNLKNRQRRQKRKQIARDAKRQLMRREEQKNREQTVSAEVIAE